MPSQSVFNQPLTAWVGKNKNISPLAINSRYILTLEVEVRFKRIANIYQAMHKWCIYVYWVSGMHITTWKYMGRIHGSYMLVIKFYKVRQYIYVFTHINGDILITLIIYWPLPCDTWNDIGKLIQWHTCLPWLLAGHLSCIEVIKFQRKWSDQGPLFVAVKFSCMCRIDIYEWWNKRQAMLIF